MVEKCATGSFYLENNLHYYALSDSGYEGLKEIYSFGREQLETTKLQRQLGQFVGNWEYSGAKSKMQETWRKGEDHLFVARGFELDLKGKVIFEEDIFLDTLAGKITYVVDLGSGREYFPLEKMTAHSFTFSRAGEDWPQSIEYTFTGKDSLKVVLDGTDNGKSNRQDLTFINRDALKKFH